MSASEQLGAVLITGATSGIGLATAREFAEHGYPLIITGRRTDRLVKLADELSTIVPVYACTLDVCQVQDIKKLYDGIPDAFKKIQVLINNAGLALGCNSADKSSLEDWHKMIDTNITGLVNVTHYFLPQLMQQPSATIVNLASIAGNWPYPGGNVYGASKSFVTQFSRNLRCDLVGTGVRVTSLEPGLCESEFSLVRFKGDQAKAKALYAGANALQSKDIANIILWLVRQPPHININSLEVMPTSQAWNQLNIIRE